MLTRIHIFIHYTGRYTFENINVEHFVKHKLIFQ